MEESRWNTKGRNIILFIVKKDKEADHWPRLTKEKVKTTHFQVDWANYLDQDDEEEKGGDAAELGGDFDPSEMEKFGGGMGANDSDDEEEEEEEVPATGEAAKEEEGKEAEKAKGADLDDLDKEEEDTGKKEAE